MRLPAFVTELTNVHLQDMEFESLPEWLLHNTIIIKGVSLVMQLLNLPHKKPKKKSLIFPCFYY